ncbi:MAG: glutamate-pyruvate aminotransferase [Gammaproteobacteria bacterium]|nr:glutamate-pyruvate aminotransferase [Gammaproteobacteria bacterium]
MSWHDLYDLTPAFFLCILAMQYLILSLLKDKGFTELNKEFPRINRLPPYVFAIVNELKMEARRRGEDIIDFGMGNPDQPTPKHIIDKLVEVASREDTHRYSLSRGIPRLRRAICNWYKQRYNVDLDPESEAIVTIGSKEGLSHLAMAIVDRGDAVLVPNPAYPIHPFGFVIAGADVRHVPTGPGIDFFTELEKAIRDSWPKPKLLILNYPANPTTECVELPFFQKVIDIAREHKIWVIQDLAYADLVFDGYKAPSILEVPGAKDIAVEFFTLSKSYNMPGWRVGFMVGNPTLVNALARLKSYLDYGLYTPIQVAAITALEGDQQCVADICEMYRRRRDVLCEGLNAAGWKVEKPRGTMFVWAPIPEQFQAMGSLEFSKKVLLEAKVAVSPGVGFGEYGDKFVRFALIENEHRTRQAVRGIRAMLREETPALVKREA